MVSKKKHHERRTAARTPETPDPSPVVEVPDGSPAELGEDVPAPVAANADGATSPDVAAEAEHPAVAELGELKDRYLRLAAEYDNFRKRTAREREELRTRAHGELAGRLLEALDDLGRVAHLDAATAAAADVIAGVELVERKVLRELGAVGLQPVAAVDVPFDPSHHEAIATVPAATEDEDHTVAAVFQVGYRLDGMLLRPARVQVRIWTPPASV